MGNYIYHSEEFIIRDVNLKTQYTEYYSGSNITTVPYYKTTYSYDALSRPVTIHEMGTEPQYTPSFSVYYPYVAIINNKYTVYLDTDIMESEKYVVENFSIGTKFSVTTYLDCTFLSTDKVTCYLWPKMQLNI